jgi:hypothetical protein
MHLRLESKLRNDEPKCANCAFWAQIYNNPYRGYCTNGSDSDRPVTADLSVCSAWELSASFWKTEGK